MIPFTRIIIYANKAPIPPMYSAPFVMHASDGFVDLATPSRTITLTNTPTISTTQFLPGQHSSYGFTSGFITIPTAQITDLNIGKASGDFTIEYYAYIINAASNYWYLSSGTGVTSDIKIFSGTLYLQGRTKGASASTATIPVGRWTHYALVQDGTNIRWYMDGKLSMTVTGDRWGDVNTPLRIGGYELVSNGYYDQIRITNSALYSGATITMPAYPLM